jgi:PAS domain S-box-containing protein
MNMSLRVLIVEDSEADAFLIERELRNEGYALESLRVDNETAFLAALDSRPWDVIIADYSLPQFNAPAALLRLQQKGLDLPFIIVSGAIGEEVAVAAMKAGAHDFIVKNMLARLVPAIEREVRDAAVRRERRLAEAGLAESEARLSAIVNSAMDAIITVDSAQRIVLFNSAAEKMFGCSASEMLGQPVERLIPGRFRSHHKEHIQQFGDSGAGSRAMGHLNSIHGLRSNGEEFAAEASISCIDTSKGRLFTAILRDISERQRAENAREQLMRDRVLLLESSGEGTYGIDTGGRITFVNQAAAKMLGRPLEELLGEHSHSLFHHHRPNGSPYPVEECPAFRAVQRGERCRTEDEVFWRADGSSFPVEYIAYPILEGESIKGAVVTFNDITDRKASEEKLRFQAHLLNTIGQGIIGTDLDGTVNFWSRGAESLYGWSAAEALGRDVIDLTVPDTSRAQAVEIMERMRAGECWSGEFDVRHRDGHTFTALVSNSPVHNLEGRLIGIVGSSSDITERKQSEEELRHSREQLRALAAHLQSIREEERKLITRDIHDELGQALTGFKMDLAWMRNRLKDEPPEPGPLLEKIESLGGMIDETANTIRRLCAELRPGVLDDLGLVPALEWQAREFTRRTGLACEFTCIAKDLLVDAEQSTAVFRIFQEILTNVARHAQATRVSIIVKASMGWLILDARDDGRGILESEIAGASSLGLLGMRERAIAIGGQLEIRRGTIKGTTVSLSVPLNTSSATK